MGNAIGGIFVGVIGSLLATALYPPLQATLLEFGCWLKRIFDRDEFDLTDTWNAMYTEQDGNGQTRTTTETIKLRQYGQIVRGTSSIGPPDQRSFQYQLRVFHNLLLGCYKRHEEVRGTIQGAGVLLVRIDDSRKTMCGKCVWLDADTNKIEVSDYSLTRVC